MNSREADELADQLTRYLADGDSAGAFAALSPFLKQRIPFHQLDRIAATTRGGWPATREMLELISAGGSEGGWVVIGRSLHRHYPSRSTVILEECRRYIVAANSWYGADIIGERLPGPALVNDFEHARVLLAPWRDDANRWVRRSVGVAVHFWAKRSLGDQSLAGRAEGLLAFLEPMFEEWDMDAVKGVGWGLKTLGKVYPQQLTNWLLDQRGRPYRRLMMRKAVTYLPDDQRHHVLEAYGL